MPPLGPDALFCKIVENSFYGTKKIIDWTIDTSHLELWVKKILSMCNRYVKITFKFLFDELSFWADQISEMKRIILKSKYAKNLKRICLDMMKCIALYELVAGKEVFGNKTVEELSSPEEFEKFVCNGGWLKQAEAFIQEQIKFVEGKIADVKSFIDSSVMQELNWIVKGYNIALKAGDVAGKLEKLDIITGCVFGICSIGDTVTNYKADIIDRLYMTPNGRADKARFKKLLTDGGTDKLTEKMNAMSKDMLETQDQWMKRAKNTISHSLPTK